MKLYVGNIAYNMTEPELTDLFAASGTVVSAKIVTEYFSGRSPGDLPLSRWQAGLRAIRPWQR